MDAARFKPSVYYMKEIGFQSYQHLQSNILAFFKFSLHLYNVYLSEIYNRF